MIGKYELFLRPRQVSNRATSHAGRWDSWLGELPFHVGWWRFGFQKNHSHRVQRYRWAKFIIWNFINFLWGHFHTKRKWKRSNDKKDQPTRMHSAAVAVSRGVCLGWRMSAWDGGCLPGMGLSAWDGGCTPHHPSPHGQADACQKISLPQLLLRTVINDKHQRKFSFSLPLSLGVVNGP